MKDQRTALSSLLAGTLMLGTLLAWSPATWPVTAMQVGIFAIALAVVVLAIVRPAFRAMSFPRSSLYIPLPFIGCWALFQLAFHSTVYPFDTGYAALYWFANAVVCLLAMALLRDVKAREGFLAALLYFGCGVVVISIFQSYTSPYKVFWLFSSKYRVIGPFIYKNQFAAFVELILPIALYRMLIGRKNSWIFAFLSATMFAAVVASASRAGTALLGLEIVAAFLAGWRRGLISRRIAVILFAQVCLFSGICTAVIGWDELGKHFQDQTNEGARLKLTQATLQIVRDYPILGVGLGNWKTVYPSYALFDNGQYANAAHDDWVQWMAEGGIPFAGLLLWLVAVAARAAVRHPWGAGVVFVFLHSALDYPAREPVVGALLFALLGAMAAASPLKREAYSIKRITTNL